ACPTGAITLEQNYKLASYHPEDMVFHKETLLEAKGHASVGSASVWLEPAPAQPEQPLPQKQHIFDGSGSSSAAVGLGDLETERQVLIANADQDQDRRSLQQKHKGEK